MIAKNASRKYLFSNENDNGLIFPIAVVFPNGQV